MAATISERECWALAYLAARGGLASAFDFHHYINARYEGQGDLLSSVLVTQSLVNKLDGLHGAPWFEITPADGCGELREEPISVNVCHRPEAPAVSRATVCIDEDELNEWWEGLDVECKADAFLQFTLGCGGVVVSAPAPIFLRGTVGENNAALVERSHDERIARLTESLSTIRCFYCQAPFAGNLSEAHISRCASLLRRVCNRRECRDRWADDIEAARETIARGGELGGEPLAPPKPIDGNAPLDADLVCTKCWKIGGQWDLRMSKPQWRKGDPLEPGEAMSCDASGGGPWIYTHRCADEAAN
jgi:hypothetical protein